MLKKLSLAGLVLMASSGIAFADPNDSMPAADTGASSDAASSSASDASMSNTGSSDTSAAPVKKHHKHHKKHKRHHHYRSHAAAPAPESDAVVSAAPAYKGDYKGEIAAPCPTCPPGIQAGPYVGLGIGSLVNYSSHHANYNGFQGNLFGGYGWMWDQWYGGLEVFVNDNFEMTNNTSPTYGSVKSTWSYGGSIMPGYLIQENVLGFLRLGVIETRFNSSPSNKWKFGGQVGLGLETMLCQNWGLRGEWMYNFYNSLGSNSVGVPRSQQANLSLLYNFQF